MDPFVAALAVLVMLAGLAGVVVPVVPGLLLVWLASVGTTLWMGADTVGWVVATVLTLMFVAGTAVTVWLPARQGRRGGVPASSLAAAVLGALVGFVLIPVVGLLVGVCVGLLLAEYRRVGEWRQAFEALMRVMRAYGLGVVIELVIGVMMISVWVVAVLLR